MELPKGFSSTVLDPALTSSADFVSRLETFVLNHDFLNHHLLTSIATGALGQETCGVVYNLMSSYQYFSKNFTSYLKSLKDLLKSQEHIDVISENEAEENGKYNAEELDEICSTLGVSRASVDGLPHSLLFEACKQAVKRASLQAASSAVGAAASAAQSVQCADQPFSLKADSLPGQLGLKQPTEIAPGSSAKPGVAGHVSEDVLQSISKAMVDAFNSAVLVSETQGNASAILGALYFASELIVPRLYRKIMQGLKTQSYISNDDIAFFLLHVEVDTTHAQKMRSVVLDHATTTAARADMIRASVQIMEARTELLNGLVQTTYVSTDSNAVQPNDKLYDIQNQQWVRTKPACLSDFTGRPVVFKLCEAHVQGSWVLDIGCGEGYVARKLMEMGAKRSLGVDVSPEMIKRAMERASNKEKYLCGDAKNMRNTIKQHQDFAGLVAGADLETGCFDLTVGCFVL